MTLKAKILILSLILVIVAAAGSFPTNSTISPEQS